MTVALKDHLDRRLELLSSMKALAARQHGIIAARETDELLRLLAAREKLTEQMLADQAAFNEAAAVWKAEHGTADRTVMARLETAELLLKEILDLDARDEVAIREACGYITDEIKEVTTTTAARNAYQKRPPASAVSSDAPRYTDASG